MEELTHVKENPISKTDCVRVVLRSLLIVITILFVISMLVLFPLYYDDKYFNMGTAKYQFFRNTTFVYIGLMCVVGFLNLLFHIKEFHPRKILKKMIVLDWFVIAYLVVTLLSFGLSEFKADALWGSSGWYMGLVSQISFVLIYFFVSRFMGVCKRKCNVYIRWILAGFCITASIVFALAVLHRFLIDPLKMYEGLDEIYYIEFLSTLGQATWYSSFLVIALPIGFAFYSSAKSKIGRIASSLYLFLGFASLVTQNSDSAYLGIVLALFLYFWYSFSSTEQGRRFWEIIVIMFISFVIIGIFQNIFVHRAIKLEPLSTFLSQSPLSIILLLISASILLFISYNSQNKNRQISAYAGIRKGAFIVLLLSPIVLTLCIVLVTVGVFPESWKEIPYLYFNKNWGTGRGFTWGYAVEAFAEFSFKNTLLGVGPDCFWPYANAYHGEKIASMWGNLALTNAHNEWLNMLIVGGVAGLVSYGGIFIEAIRTFLKRSSAEPLLLGIAATVIAYMGHNLFCYQQSVCTSTIFILLGIGRYLYGVSMRISA